MTKKEFEYWKEHKLDLLNAYLLEIYLHNFNYIKEVDIALDSHYHSSKPTLREHIHCSRMFYTARYEILNVEFKNDSLIIITQRKHNYIDNDGQTLVPTLVGPILEHIFPRENINKIFVRTVQDSE